MYGCQLQIGDAKIIFNILTENGKCNHKTCIRIVKDAFQKLSKILRIRKILLETKKSTKLLQYQSYYMAMNLLTDKEET